jgi:hypothetical protein
LSGLIWLVIGTDGGCYEYSRNETLVYIKRWKFREDYEVLGSEEVLWYIELFIYLES